LFLNCNAAAAVVQVSAPTDGVFGCGAHSDYGMLTILATDSVPGLQVRDLAVHVYTEVQEVALCSPDGAQHMQRALLCAGYLHRLCPAL
jgi:hypothetical protein